MEGKHKNGGLGAAKSCIAVSSLVLECWGSFGVKKTSPPAPFLCFHAEGACQGELSSPRQANSAFFLQEFFAKFDYPPGLHLFILIPWTTSKLGVCNFDFKKYR